jgi:digalactosyldiacylglycerol synthase
MGNRFTKQQEQDVDTNSIEADAELLTEDSSSETTSTSSNSSSQPPDDATTLHPLCTGCSFLKRRPQLLFEPQDGDETVSPLVVSARSHSWLSFSSQLEEPDVEYYTPDELVLDPDKPFADLRTAPLYILTTAALPWMTGTAVNPLLRAAHLVHYRIQQNIDANVHLVIPWLDSPVDRVALYGEDWRHKTQDDQARYIQHWLTTCANLPADTLGLQFYPARYHAGLSSIFAMGDVLEGFVDASSILILEEPEHLNYYRAPAATGKKPFTVGIVHTNYKYYATQHVTGLFTAPLVAAISAGLVRAYCDQVIKLSGILQDYAPHKQTVCNVHGVRHEFLQKEPPMAGEVYFLGKLLWAKGLDHLLLLQDYYRQIVGQYFEMHIYGSGPEQDEIQRAYLGYCESPTTATTTTEEGLLEGDDEEISKRKFKWRIRRRRPLPVKFCGRMDHAAIGPEYKIFVNPSVSEVLCTTTAEALAMGKFVVLPQHPSNNFFQDFPNALFFKTPAEFVSQLVYAQEHAPVALSNDLRHALSWEAATERLFHAATVSERDAARRERLYGPADRRLADLHYELGRGRKGDVLRKVLGGGPVADQVHYQKLMQRREEA